MVGCYIYCNLPHLSIDRGVSSLGLITSRLLAQVRIQTVGYAIELHPIRAQGSPALKHEQNHHSQYNPTQNMQKKKLKFRQPIYTHCYT